MKLIVSLTTTSRRIGSAAAAIDSISRQNPDEIHLYISREGFLFDDGVSSPASLEREDVQIHYVPNTGPYRKLLHMLREGRDVLIVTVDDDTQYPPYFLSRLREAYERHRCIVAYRGRKLTRLEEGLAAYKEWPQMISGPENVSELNYPIGQSGILYPPGCFTERVFDPKAFELSPSACEPWFYANMRLAGGEACVLGEQFPFIRRYEDCLWTINKERNDVHLRAVADYLGVKL